MHRRLPLPFSAWVELAKFSFVNRPAKNGYSASETGSRQTYDSALNAIGREVTRNPVSFRHIAILLWVFISGATTAALPPIIDDTGQTVQLEKTAERIVSLSPHATELIFSAGAGHRLVGATDYCNHPEAAKSVPRIGDAARLDRERLLSLKPDLVIAWPSGNRTQDLAWLEKRGIPIYRSEPDKLEKIAENIREIGQLAGTVDTAVKAADTFDTQLQELRDTYGENKPTRVFYQVWHRPLMTIGKDHIINQVLKLCGGRTIFPNLTPLAPVVSREAVIAANPQVILSAVETGSRNDPFSAWRRWRSLSAIADNRLIRIPADIIHRPTARLLEGARLICQGLAN